MNKFKTQISSVVGSVALGIVALSTIGVMPVLALEVNGTTEVKVNANTNVGTMNNTNTNTSGGGNANTNVGVSLKTTTDMNVSGRDTVVVRTNSLNDLIVRLGNMKRLSQGVKDELTASVRAEINALANSTSTTNINSKFRIYMLVEPKIHILAASDRADNIAGMLQALIVKFEARLAQATSSNSANIQSYLADMKAKTANAQVQADAAANLVVNLKADQGDKIAIQSNNKALVDARAKLKLATQDLEAARKDAKLIIEALKGTNE